MSRRKYTPEQIISKLRAVEVPLAQGATVPLAVRGIGVTDQTYYRWRREYGGLTVGQAKRLKEMEKENLRLRRAVSDLTLEKLILKEAAEGNFQALLVAVCSLSAFNRFTRKRTVAMSACTAP